MSFKLVVRIIIILILTGIAGGIYVYITSSQRPLTPEEDEATFTDEFRLVLKDYDGADVRLSDFKREFLIVYMWASWCPYCKAELENLAQLKRSYGDKVQVLAVNRAEPLPIARDYTDSLQDAGELVFLLDPADALYKDVNGYAMPETIFITRNGDVLYHQRGPVQLKDVDEKIQELLHN